VSCSDRRESFTQDLEQEGLIRKTTIDYVSLLFELFSSGVFELFGSGVFDTLEINSRVLGVDFLCCADTLDEHCGK